MPRRTPGSTGFTLLPVVLAMSLTAAIAFLLNRDNGINANLIGAQSDRERARYAAEAGLQAVNYAIQALGCAGTTYPILSLPLEDDNFGGAAKYSAHANSAYNTIGSPLTLTSKGTYNGASVTLTKTNAYVYQSGVRTWVTQPGPATGKDASVDEANPTQNFGGDNDLEIERNNKQTLIAFDLSPLPAGSRIVRWFQTGVGLREGAKISLYQGNWDANNDFSVMLITHDWVAGTRNGTVPTVGSPGVTWNLWNAPSSTTWSLAGKYHPRKLIVVPEPPWWANWVDIDVTDAAVGWTSGVYPNYGVWLVPFSNTRDYRFASSNEDPGNASGNAWKRPKLTAYYLLPCGASAPP